jgi:hypothetical protein
MMTLSTNFGNILKKYNAINSRYVIKIARTNQSTYAASSLYVSDAFGDITDGGSTYPVHAVVLNESIKITENIDVRNHSSTIGGFSLSLSYTGDMVDNIDDYWFYNKEIKIYFGDSSLTTLSDYLLLYTGNIRDFVIEDDILTFEIENSTFTVQKKLPQNKITTSDGNLIPAENINSPKTLAYGDHPFYYGQDGTLTNITHRQDNNMVKCKYLGLDTDGKHRYLIANHALYKTNDTYYRAWMYDPRVNRYVKIDTTEISYTTSGNDTILKIDPDFHLYDYLYPVSTDNFGYNNPNNIIDLSYTTYANSAPGSGEFKYVDVNFTYTGNESELVSAKLFFKTYFDEGDAAATFTLFSGGTDLSGLSDETLQSVTVALSGTSIENPVTFYHNAVSSTNSTTKVYMCFYELRYLPTELFDVYVACQGRKASFPLESYFNDIAMNALIENPAHVITSLIVDELGLFPDTTKLTTIETELTSWKFAPVIYKQKDSKQIIDELARQCKSVVFWSALNKPKFDTFFASNTTNKEFKINDIKAHTLKTYKTSLSDIVNDYKLNYNSDASGHLQSSLSREDDRANVGSQAVYNAVMEEVQDAEAIYDTTTAGLLADHWCKDDDDSYWSELHDIVEFETAGLRGINYWESGTFKPTFTLELTDIIEFDHTEFDGLKLCNGESWEDKQFKIIGIVRDKSNIKIKAIEL